MDASDQFGKKGSLGMKPTERTLFVLLGVGLMWLAQSVLSNQTGVIVNPVLGISILLLVGICAIRVPTAKARHESNIADFDTLTCRQIKITDERGTVLAVLGNTPHGDGSANDVFQVFNAQGTPVCHIGSNANGGHYGVCDNDGHMLGTLTTLREGGTLTVHGKDESPRVSLSAIGDRGNVQVFGSGRRHLVGVSGTDDGGAIVVFGADRSPKVALGVEEKKKGGYTHIFDERGFPRAGIGLNANGHAVVSVSAPNGETRAALGCDDDGGIIQVRGNDNELRADVNVGKFGGSVSVYNSDALPKAGLYVDEYDRGTVAKWDNENNLKSLE